MKTTIQKILKYNEQDYDMVLLELYVLWCTEMAYSDAHLQLLLINKKLFNWFLMEYHKRELQFADLSKNYIGKVAVNDLRKIHLDWTAKIEFYPNALLSKIVKKAKHLDTVPLYKNTNKPAYNLN